MLISVALSVMDCTHILTALSTTNATVVATKLYRLVHQGCILIQLTLIAITLLMSKVVVQRPQQRPLRRRVRLQVRLQVQLQAQLRPIHLRQRVAAV